MNWKTLKRFGTRRRNQALLAAVLALTLVAVTGVALARRTARRGWPRTDGTLTVAGLEAPVTVVRDRYGVPHLFAASEIDLAFAQGYVHAQDRFWQMELSRRRGGGRLAELLGEAWAAVDAEWQALELPQLAAGQLLEMEAGHLAILDAYAQGVNAWLAQNRGRLPFEFTLLRRRDGPDAAPVPWRVQDSMVVALALGWQMGAPQLDPSMAERIVDRVGPERGGFLLNEASGGASLQAPDGVRGPLPRGWALRGRVTLVNGREGGADIPLLAVDLPTDLSLPAPWYVMAWQADLVSSSNHQGTVGGAGASVPGLPGLLVGTGDLAAWQSWSETGTLALEPGTPPWKRWLLAVLLDGGEIVQLADDKAPQDVTGFQERQMDTFSARAARLIPLLAQVRPEGWRQERAATMWPGWDYRIGDNNKEAPFFVVYQRELARAAFADELGDELFEVYVAQAEFYQVALDQILLDPDAEWWDDVTTPERELRSDILQRAYAPALEWIGRNYGDLHMLWEWDLVHGTRLHHPLGDAWPWDQLLSRDLHPDGWADTVNASPGGLPCVGGICLGGDFFRANAVYGYRQILDAGEPATLWFTLLPGQSGHPFHPHYADLLDEWLAGTYVPLRLVATPADLEAAASVLVLTPQAGAQ